MRRVLPSLTCTKSRSRYPHNPTSNPNVGCEFSIFFFCNCNNKTKCCIEPSQFPWKISFNSLAKACGSAARAWAMEKLNEPGGGKSLSPGDIRNGGAEWLWMLFSISSSCGELKLYFDLSMHNNPFSYRHELPASLPQRALHLIHHIVWMQINDRIIAVLVVRINAVAYKFHRLGLNIVWWACWWRWCQAFLVCRWSQASAAVTVLRQIDCVFQIVVVVDDVAVRDIVVSAQCVVVVACNRFRILQKFPSQNKQT